MPDDKQRERIIDAVLAAVTLVVAVLMMLAESQGAPADAEPGAIPRAVVRAIEEPGLVIDADRDLAPATRAAIGVATHPDASPPVVMAKLRDDIRRAYPTSHVARLVWIAMAAGFRMDQDALTMVHELLSDEKALATHGATLDDLTNLAAGRGVAALPRLEQSFVQMGASRWLVERLRERHFGNIGDEVARAAADQACVSMAGAAMDRRAASEFVQLGFVALGLLVLALFPWFVRPRLEARGFLGLTGTSPFRVDRSRRVMLAWFLAYVLLGAVLPRIFDAFFPIDPRTDEGLRALALRIALQGLAHGAAGVTFIRLWGRREDDTTPLGQALGLTARPLPRRAFGLFIWALPGTGVVFTSTVLAILVTTVLFGPIHSSQIALEVVVSDAHLDTFLLIVLGAVVIAPVMEEILFRGYLFRNLRDALGKGPALFVSGLVFAVVHYQPSLLVPLLAMGVALGLLYEWTGSLLVPIAGHALWNLAQLIEARVQYQV